MSKTKQSVKQPELTAEQMEAADQKRRSDISSMFSRLNDLERLRGILAASKDSAQVKIELPGDSYYRTLMLLTANIRPALASCIAIEMAEIKEKLFAFGVQP